MSDEPTFSLIGGRFAPETVVPMLTEITNAKLEYHAQKIARHEHSEDIKASEKRIRQLEADFREVLAFLREATQRGSQVDIEGTIRFQEVHPRT